MTDSAEDILLRGVVRVENVENPAQYIPAVLSKCRVKHLERTYDIRGWSSASSASDGVDGATGIDNMVGGPNQEKAKIEEATRFLDALARKGGRLLKGGEADLDGVAKMVLNDFLRGKIPWFVPPETEGSTGEGVRVDEGSDEALGITHGKRKRELNEEVAEMVDEAGEDGVVVVGDGEGGEEMSEGFEGFEDKDEEEEEEDEEDEEDEVDEEGESSDGGIGVDAGLSGSGDEDDDSS